MNKLFSLLCCLLLTVSAWAYQGQSCADPIPVDIEYSGSFPEGEYWFTATTLSLPLTIYYYPEDTTAEAPEVWIDLTCTEGVYDDPKVAAMLQTADQYGLSFPMKEVPERQTDDRGRVFYRILYDRNYRDMLYNQGVTYAVPAYVKLVTHTQGSVDIVSKSINSQCREYVNTLGLNTALRYAPADSAYVLVWPIGEWINKKYRISWSGEGAMTWVDGKDCLLTRHSRMRDLWNMPQDTILMNTARTSSWINEIYQTELYVRLFPEAEGVLKIEEYEEKNELLGVIVDGIPAVIDTAALTVTVQCASGMTRAQMARYCRQNATFEYISYDGQHPQFNNTGIKIIFGTVVYTVTYVSAPNEGSYNATLSQILLNGEPLDGFSPAVLNYQDIEVVSVPQIEALAADSLAALAISAVDSLPATVTITVTAEAGNTQTYTLSLIAGRSKETALAWVKMDGEAFVLQDGVYSYRQGVSRLPQLTAQAVDSLATLQIEQAKGVPGFAQITVTAEAGNTQVYTFNFVMSERFETCLGQTPALSLNTPVALSPSDPDAVYNIPIKEWADQYLSFQWSGAQDLTVYVGTSCFYDPAQPDETLLDSFLISLPKGEPLRHYDFRPATLHEYLHESLDKTLYLRFSIPCQGSLTITQWEETCFTESQFLDLPSVTPIAADSRLKYRIYLPDWQNKTVVMAWQGASDARAFVADACDFYLTADNLHVLQPSPYDFSAGADSVAIAPNMALAWTYFVENNFAYLRFINTLPGTLTLHDAAEPAPTALSNSALENDLRITYAGALCQITSEITQLCNLYSITGRLVERVYLEAHQPTTLNLPQGVYLIQHATGVAKIIR